MSSQEHPDEQAIARELNTVAAYRLDLGNPLHYRLVLEILQRGGETPHKSPEFLQRGISYGVQQEIKLSPLRTDALENAL